MKHLVLFGATLVLAALVALAGCSSAAPAAQPTKPAAGQGAAQPTSAPAAQQAAAGSKFPSKGVEIIVGFDPGSGSDTTTRAFVPFLQKALGQTVTVINQGGAGGALSWGNIAKAKPDGYTIGYLPMPSMQNAAVLSKVEYDPLNSFDYLGMIAYDPVALAVKAGGPYKTLDDFIAAAQKDPGKVSIGATGKSSNDYTIGLSIQKAKNVKFNIVNFDGTPAGITAVMGDNLAAMGMNASNVLPYEKSGQLKTLAVGGDSRFPQLPDTPTFKEKGIALYVQGVYRGFMVPKGVPKDVYDTLVKAVKTASDDPEWKAAADKIALPLMYIPPDQTATLAKQLNDAAKEYLTQ